MRCKWLLLYYVILVTSTTSVNTQATRPLDTHVLDNTTGGNGANILVKLYKGNPSTGNFDLVTTTVTDIHGRVDLIPAAEFGPGTYRLWLDTKSYFGSQGKDTFWPEWETTFKVTDTLTDYHVPVIISQFGFSTYRGS